jgi:hypothetical protein
MAFFSSFRGMWSVTTFRSVRCCAWQHSFTSFCSISKGLIESYVAHVNTEV